MRDAFGIARYGAIAIAIGFAFLTYLPAILDVVGW